MVFKIIIIALILVLTQTQEYDPDLSFSYLYYSKNAYCSENNLKDWSCKSCQYNKGTIDIKILSDGEQGTFGYTAYNPAQKLIIAAFRGSVNNQNWIDDLDFVLVDYPFCKDCKVHKGFYRAWNTLEVDTLANVLELKQKYPTAEILVTGHSLGGVLCEFAAISIIKSGLTVEHLYNYGTPRSGNTAFASYVNGLIGQAMRVVHYKDPAPHYPLQVMGYRQIPTEVWYYEKNKPEMYKVCEMPGVEEDPHCSDGELDLVWEDNSWYLGINVGCNMGVPDEEEQYKNNTQKMYEKIRNQKLNYMIKYDKRQMKQIKQDQKIMLQEQ